MQTNNCLEINRNISMDVVRCIAFFATVVLHSFCYIFYLTEVKGISMYILLNIQTFSKVCIPLFLLLTGYFMNKKRLSRDFYLRSKRILLIYIMCSILCIAYSVYHQDITTIGAAIYSIISFQIPTYGWYLELYLGLYLLIPFLNIMYHGLETKKRKQILILALFILTILPTMLNIFDLASPTWWMKPGETNAEYQLIPSWWTKIYPFTYYFIGAYFSEYTIAISKKINFLFMFLSILFSGLCQYWLISGGTCGVADTYNDWNGFLNFFPAVILFAYFSRINIKNIAGVGKWLIITVSKLSFAAFLLSWMFGNIVYPRIDRYFINIVKLQLAHFGGMLIVSIASLIVAAMIEKIYALGERLCKKILKVN